MFLIPGNHDEFEGTGEIGSEKIWGGGQGTFQLLVGPMKHFWTYGDVSFVSFFSDDRNVEDTDLAWAEAQMATDTFKNSITRILMTHHPLYKYEPDGETIVDPQKTQMLNALQTHKVTHYLHGHLHEGWHHLLDGVHHISAPQTYPFTESQNLGGYIKYNVTQGNITSWVQYIDGVVTELDEPTIAPPKTTTETDETPVPGFSLFLSIIAIPIAIVYNKKRRK